MIEYKQYWSFVGGEKPKDSLAIEKKQYRRMEKKYEKENVEDGVVRIDSVQHVVHYAGVGMGGRWTPKHEHW